MRIQSGITLVETLVTLILLTLLTTLAAPGFRTLIQNTRMSLAVNDLLYALQNGRSEAIKSAGKTSLCTLSGDTDWAGGWRLITGNDCILMAGEREVLRQEPVPGLDAIAAGNASVTFRRNGQALAGTTFTLCDRRGAAHARALEVTLAGRIRSLSLYTDGSPLTCP